LFLDLCSFSYDDQGLLLATIDLSVLPRLLLLFCGVYHNNVILNCKFFNNYYSRGGRSEYPRDEQIRDKFVI